MHLSVKSISCVHSSHNALVWDKVIALALFESMEVVKKIKVTCKSSCKLNRSSRNYLERSVSRVKSQVSGKNERRETFDSSILSSVVAFPNDVQIIRRFRCIIIWLFVFVCIVLLNYCGLHFVFFFQAPSQPSFSFSY